MSISILPNISEKERQKAMASSGGSSNIEVYHDNKLDHTFEGVEDHSFAFPNWVHLGAAHRETVDIGYGKNLPEGDHKFTHSSNPFFVAYQAPGADGDIRDLSSGELTVEVKLERDGRMWHYGELEFTFKSVSPVVRIKGSYRAWYEVS